MVRKMPLGPASAVASSRPAPPELAALVLPMRAEVERTGAANVLQPIGGKTLDMATIRLMAWAIRGMTMGAPSSPTARAWTRPQPCSPA